MRRIILYVAFVPAFYATVSCASENLSENAAFQGAPMLSASASLNEGNTKVSYEENEERNFCGTWEEGDVIFGFKDDGTPFDFTVSSVADGTAVLSQIGGTLFTAGDVLYAISMPGRTSADLSGTSLAVDFSKQSADCLPSLVLSTAVVTEGPCVHFQFENAVSVVALKNPLIGGEFSEGKKVVKLTLSGHEIVSSGVVSVRGGALVFTGDAPCNFIEKEVNLPAVASASGYTLEVPVYVAVPAGKIAKISVLDNRNGFYEYAIDKTAETGKYYMIDGRTLAKAELPAGTSVVTSGVEWSVSNLGGDKSTAAGNLYRWCDDGLIYTEVSSSTVTPDSAHPRGFANYPGEIYCTEADVYSKYNETGLVLEPVDDIVQLTYPGTGWRMPTVEEFQSLAALKDNSEYTVSLNDGTFVGIKYTRNSDDATVLLRGNQPCSGSKAGTATAINIGRYWTSSSTTDAAKGYAAQYFRVVISSKLATGETQTGVQKRFYGYSVRPVKPVQSEE